MAGEEYAFGLALHSSGEPHLGRDLSSDTTAGHKQRTVMYQITELVGKWSMVDVFVVAILVALVHLGGLLVIRPGIAALSFAGVVIVTMVAAESFDPRLIWDQLDSDNE